MIWKILKSQSLGAWLGDFVGAFCVMIFLPAALLFLSLLFT